MCHGFTSASAAVARRASRAIAAVLCLLVIAMADPVDAVEEIHLPLPPPIQGALTAGPFNFQFTGEDHLRLSVANTYTGVRVAVHYRTAPTTTTTQSNRQELGPTADRVVNTMEFDVGPGYLLNVVVFASSGSPRRGQTYVKLEVIRGFGPSAIVLGCICAGYVTANQPIAWPGSPIEASIDGDGYPRVITGTQPSAGFEISETVPTGARWRLRLFRARLLNGNVAGTRQPNLAVSSGSVIMALVANPGSSAINQAADYYWAAGLGFATVTINSVNIAGIAPDASLVAGSAIATSTVGLNALDAWLAPTFTVQEWLEV